MARRTHGAQTDQQRHTEVAGLRAEKAARLPLMPPWSTHNLSPSSHQNKCKKQKQKTRVDVTSRPKMGLQYSALSPLFEGSHQNTPLLSKGSGPPKLKGKARGDQARITDTSRQHSGSDPNTLLYSNRVKLVNGNLSPTEEPPARPCLPLCGAQATRDFSTATCASGPVAPAATQAAQSKE